MTKELDFLLVTLIIVVNIFLSVLVYLTDKKSWTNKIFSLFIFSVTLWILTAFLADSSKNEIYNTLFSKFAYASVVLSAINLFYFSFNYPTETKIKAVYNAWIILIGVPLFILTFTTNMVVSGIKSEPWGFTIIFGNLYYFFLIYILSSVLHSIIRFVLMWRKTKGEDKKKLIYLFIGLAIFILTSAFINFGLRAIVHSDEYYKLGNYSIIIFVSFVAFAIIKHKLFNIKVILTQTATGVVVLALLVQTLLSKSSSQWIINIIVLSLVSYGGYLLIKSVQDEIKKKEKLQELTTQLAQANAHLQELDKMKTEFVSLASHELFTPVSAIEGNLSMVLDEKLIEVKNAKLSQYLDRIYKSAKRLARLIADMLNISRIEEGRLLVEKKETELSELIKQVIDEIKFKAEERKQKVVYKDHQHLPTFADPDKVKEVVVNIIGNAIKYSKNPGTITIWVERVPTTEVKQIWQGIEESLKSSPLSDQEAIKSAVDPRMKELLGDNQYLVRVKDEGIGIPKEELPKLFKKFHRVGDFSTAESQGTGLGLYISRALIELNHGRIWADSDGQGKGSTFSFTLPELACKKTIEDLEAEVPQSKEQLKPLARPSKAADEL